ncbi:hypothetical protein BJY04DRAFT_231562 [Aspergillus karnatakaensis]|uniref:uncharacterized protein n=1 Tax=Aspergillus karnatakaensis TaxID=1810916 RepID=UPI003CCD9281
MPAVAVAGGTASVGRAIVEALLANGLYKVVVFTRTIPEEPITKGAQYLAVDYSDVDSIVSVLEQHNIDTVISTTGGHGAPETEKNLIQAADKSAVTNRFIPSIFGMRYPVEHRSLPGAETNLIAIEALKTTSLQWTAVCNGSYLSPMTMVIDMAGKAAAIPGSGDTPVVFTYSKDVAKFTAALLTLDHWEEDSYVIGDRVTWNQFPKLAQDVTGEKFKVTHDPVELLRSGIATELPFHHDAYGSVPKDVLQRILATFALLFEQGLLDFPEERAVNRLFPEIKPLKVKDVLELGRGSQ